MKTIKVNLKGEMMTFFRAEAEAGINYKAIAPEFINEMKAQSGCVKVILKSRNAWNRRTQKTFYCLPE